MSSTKSDLGQVGERTWRTNSASEPTEICAAGSLADRGRHTKRSIVRSLPTRNFGRRAATLLLSVRLRKSELVPARSLCALLSSRRVLLVCAPVCLFRSPALCVGRSRCVAQTLGRRLRALLRRTELLDRVSERASELNERTKREQEHQTRRSIGAVVVEREKEREREANEAVGISARLAKEAKEWRLRLVCRVVA